MRLTNKLTSNHYLGYYAKHTIILGFDPSSTLSTLGTTILTYCLPNFDKMKKITLIPSFRKYDAKVVNFNLLHWLI